MSNTTNYTIYDFLKAETHDDVCEMVLSVVDTNLFNVTITKLWMSIIPKTIIYYVPLLSAHTDTVHKTKPIHITNTNGVLTNKDGGLGADDRAGCYIIYELLRSSVSTDYMYILTDLEEVGGVGGKDFALSDVFENDVLPKVSYFIGLDRKGSSDCASYDYDNQELFEYMADEGYNYAFGTFTDVMTFSQHSDIACFNMSIGYYNEHKANESLVLSEMYNTYNTLVDGMNGEMWSKQFIYEEPKYKYWNTYSGSSKEGTYSPVVCDVCGHHDKLYDYGWGNLCMDCILDMEEYSSDVL